jgi:hypothetical protein
MARHSEPRTGTEGDRRLQLPISSRDRNKCKGNGQSMSVLGRYCVPYIGCFDRGGSGGGLRRPTEQYRARVGP